MVILLNCQYCRFLRRQSAFWQFTEWETKRSADIPVRELVATTRDVRCRGRRASLEVGGFCAPGLRFQLRPRRPEDGAVRANRSADIPVRLMPDAQGMPNRNVWAPSQNEIYWVLIDMLSGSIMIPQMRNLIQIKGVSGSLRARLESSAETNHRSLNQEALERLERSFEIEDLLVTARDQEWINEAMAGQFRPGSVQRLREICAQARKAVSG